MSKGFWVSIPSLAGQTARLGAGLGSQQFKALCFNPLISGADRATLSGDIPGLGKMMFQSPH